VFIDGEMDVTVVPPLTRAVPFEVVYQSIVQLLGAVALNVTVPCPQRALALAPVGTPGTAFIVTVTALGIVFEQPAAVCTNNG
jgi:hypothetical protein